MARLSWDDYFFEIMEAVSRRATCNRGRAGCVIAKDKQILTTGYVGSPPGLPHCDDEGHLIKRVVHIDGHASEHCVRTIHAEQNAICQAARRGIPLEGATLYVRFTPCRVCAAMIISCGIKRVLCVNRYKDAAESENLFIEAGVIILHKNDEVQQYEDSKSNNDV